MKLLSVCFFVATSLMLFSETSFANKVELMSFDQLMSLRPAKRIEYIKDVRAVLVTLEAMEIKARKARYHSADVSDIHDKIAQLFNYLAMIPEAQADLDSAGDAVVVGSSYVLPILKGRTWACVSESDQDNYEFNTAVGTCVRKDSKNNSVGTETNHDSAAGYFDPGFNRMVAVERSCNKNETPVYVGDGPRGAVTSYCAPNSATSRMSPFRKSELTQPNSPAPSVKSLFDTHTLGSTRVTLTPSTIENSPKTAADVAVGGIKNFKGTAPDNQLVFRGQPIEKTDGLSSQESLLNGDPGPVAHDMGASDAQVAKLQQLARVEPDTPTKIKTQRFLGSQLPLNSIDGDAVANQPGIKIEDQKKKGDQQAGAPIQEKRPEETPEIVNAKNDCKPVKDFNQVRGEILAVDGKVPCVNAGNFSFYNSETAQAGQCQVIAKTPLAGVQYMTTTGKPVNGDACPASTTLCAPTVFCDSGAANHVQVFCVAIGGSDLNKNNPYTATCAKATAGKSCDPLSIKGPTHEMWAKMATDYKTSYDKFCVNGSQGFKQFFCSECQKISERLAKWQQPPSNSAPATTAPTPPEPAKNPFQPGDNPWSIHIPEGSTSTK